MHVSSIVHLNCVCLSNDDLHHYSWTNQRWFTSLYWLAFHQRAHQSAMTYMYHWQSTTCAQSSPNSDDSHHHIVIDIPPDHWWDAGRVASVQLILTHRSVARSGRTYLIISKLFNMQQTVVPWTFISVDWRRNNYANQISGSAVLHWQHV